MRHIWTPRKALRSATKTRGRRTWVWVVLVIAVNLMLSMGFVLMADRRLLVEVEEERLELTLAGREAWRGELANVRGELASARRELGVEVAELRSVLTELDREVGADDEALRSGLDELGGRVERIEGMVTVLWRAPAGSTRTRVSSIPQIPDP